MTRIHTIKAAVCLLLLGVVGLIGSPLPAAEEEPNEALIQMIVGLLSEPDRDMRALGLQQIREEVPGEAATKRFAGLLPELPPEVQSGLLEALGDRGDPAARPAVLDMLKSKEESVRAAALRALGGLGTAMEVDLLAEKAAAGTSLEKDAARQSLITLRGDEVNAAILAAADQGEPNVRVALLGVLAARNAKEALPKVLESVGHAEPSVRLAALEALRFLADENDTAAMVKIVEAAQDDKERSKAELALLAVCTRGREVCAEAIIAGLEGADVPSRLALLRALARSGGAKALETVVGRLKDEEEAVRDEAVRMLAGWPDPAAAGHLLEIAKTSESMRHQVVAIRGLVRLASPRDDQPADFGILAEVMNLAKRPEEKRLVLGVLGGVATPESLALVVPALSDPALTEEAALAAVTIVETMEDRPKDEVRAAMQKLLRFTTSQRTRQRAEKILQSL